MKFDNDTFIFYYNRHKNFGCIKDKEKAFKLVEPILISLAKSQFRGPYVPIDDLCQEMFLVTNHHLEVGSYDPSHGISFIAYIYKDLMHSCFKYLYKHNCPLSFNNKEASKVHSGINKLKELYPDASDKELVNTYTKSILPDVAETEDKFQKTYRKNISLYMLSNPQTFVKTVFDDGHEVFEYMTDEDSSDKDALREDVNMIKDICKTLLKLPKDNQFHFTDLEYKVVNSKCNSIINGEDKTNKELAEILHIKVSSFSRAFQSASSKIRAYKESPDGDKFYIDYLG